MKDAFGKETLTQRSGAKSQGLDDSVRAAKETLRRLRATAEELEYAVRQVEKSLQKAEASIWSVVERPDLEKPLPKSANDARSRSSPRRFAK